MIYFYDKYLDEARKSIQESRELRDVENDLHRLDEKMRMIEQAYLYLLPNDDIQYILKQARDLNCEIRKKYPTIDKMLDTAEKFPKRPRTIRTSHKEVVRPDEYTWLEQDKYGILCHMIIKKGITKTIEEIISHVEE